MIHVAFLRCSLSSTPNSVHEFVRDLRKDVGPVLHSPLQTIKPLNERILIRLARLYI